MRDGKWQLVIILTVGLATASANAQWVRQSGYLPSWGGTPDAIDAVGNSTVVISVPFAPAPMYLTIDGGSHFRALTSLLKWSAWEPSAVSILDNLHMWVGMPTGQILTTSDGGNTWTSQYYDTTTTQFIDYLKMFDLNNGVAVGDANPNRPTGPAVLQTSDGGAHWTNMNTSAFPKMFSGDVWRRVDFPSKSVGYFYPSIGLSLYPWTMYKTTNGGTSWNPVFFGSIQCFRFYNDRIGIAGFHDRTMIVYRTLDGGATWDTINVANYPITERGYARDFRFLPGDFSKVWHTDNWRLWFSGDTGRTWSQQPLDTSPVYGSALVFTDATHGWFLASNGLLYHTNNADHLYVTNVEQNKPERPTAFRLEPNYPNPFNPTTNIELRIAKFEMVTLRVFDLLGREVAVLVNECRPAGVYAVRWDASLLPSGVYFYRLQAGEYVETKKMVLLR
jgi:hypothetical protein